MQSDDTRALLRLVGEARELIAAGECASKHVLQGIAALARAPIAILMTAVVRPGGAVRFLDTLDHGWPSDGDRTRVYQYLQEHSVEDVLTRAALDAATDRLATVTRKDVIPTARWEKSEIHNEVHRAAGVDDALMSLQPLQSLERVRSIVLKRAWGEPPFGERERTLVHLLHAECAWAFEQRAEAALGGERRLSPRERQTLDLLFTGAAEKEVAARLGVSRHTAHDYVKRVYRKLDVTSRAELMARALRGGRSDR